MSELLIAESCSNIRQLSQSYPLGAIASENGPPSHSTVRSGKTLGGTGRYIPLAERVLACAVQKIILCTKPQAFLYGGSWDSSFGIRTDPEIAPASYFGDMKEPEGQGLFGFRIGYQLVEVARVYTEPSPPPSAFPSDGSLAPAARHHCLSFTDRNPSSTSGPIPRGQVRSRRGRNPRRPSLTYICERI